MIDQALQFLAAQLNHCLKFAAATDNQIVIVGDPGEGVNQLLLSVVNISEESSVRTDVPTPTKSDGSFVADLRPLNLSIDILLASHFDKYQMGLKSLSAAIGFLHEHPFFSRENSPDFPDGLSRLSIEQRSLDPMEMGQIWQILGTPYRPSVIYRMRSITSQTNQVVNPVDIQRGNEL